MSQQWDVLQLADIPETSPTLRALPAFFEQRGRLTDVRALYEAPTRIFGDPAADRQLVKKKSLRRHENYFRQHGTLEFKHAVHVEEIDAYLDIFFQQHIQRRALTDTPSQFLDDRQQAWNRFIWYKPSFDVAYFKHSPGEVLIKNLLEYVLERNLAEFDFTIGEEAFKYRFANHVRLNYAVHVFRHPLPYHVNRLLLDTKAFVKRSPAFIRLGRWLIRRWPSL